MSPKVKRVSKLPEQTYMFICADGIETKGLRAQHLFGHLDHIEANNHQYRVAGPIRSDPDGDITGSFFLIAAENKKAAWEMMRGDPYINSNMYASVTVQHVSPACGEWMGGVIWDQDEIRANISKYT
ncbi:MAG: YciI family protein [Alphaproteobacteria bacterium]